LLPQISQGNFYQNGCVFQSLENDPSNNNSLAMSDMATTGEYYLFTLYLIGKMMSTVIECSCSVVSLFSFNIGENILTHANGC